MTHTFNNIAYSIEALGRNIYLVCKIYAVLALSSLLFILSTASSAEELSTAIMFKMFGELSVVLIVVTAICFVGVKRFHVHQPIERPTATKGGSSDSSKGAA